MTIPKFRVWNRLTGKVFPVGIIDWTIQSVYIKQPNGLYSEKSFDEIELMQSTGLFDKNGKEIFEGDIIVAMSQGVKAVGEVKRRIDGYWLMYPAWQHGEFWHIVENVDTGKTGVEVIGNIWENGELVEETNE